MTEFITTGLIYGIGFAYLIGLGFLGAASLLTVLRIISKGSGWRKQGAKILIVLHYVASMTALGLIPVLTLRYSPIPLSDIDGIIFSLIGIFMVYVALVIVHAWNKAVEEERNISTFFDER